MEIRMVIENPNEDEIGKPVTGLVYHKNGQVMGNVKFQQRGREGPEGEDWWGEWEDIEIIDET